MSKILTEIESRFELQLDFLEAQEVKNLPAMQETWVRSPGLGRFHGEGNAAHSSTLDWRIPWTEGPGKLQSVGSQRVDTTEQLRLSHIITEGSTEGSGALF